jgi:hypothetical protein
MPLSGLKVDVKVSYLGDGGNEPVMTQNRQFTGVSIRSETAIGTYAEPAQFKGSVQLEITLTFNPTDELCLPTTPSMNAQKALHHSLDGPGFVDTKFYLFSARVEGRPSVPKAVFAKSVLLLGTSNYMKDRKHSVLPLAENEARSTDTTLFVTVLSPESGFTNGTPGDLHSDVPEEIEKLDADLYEYDEDSDLEEDEKELSGRKGKAPVSPRYDINLSSIDPADVVSLSDNLEEGSSTDRLKEKLPVSELTNGRAIAINGTAYKT